jgi:hypothetical protein
VVGAPIPRFRLLDADERAVASDDLIGQPTLLVFTRHLH